MFDAGREFYKNEISVQRLVQAMQLLESMEGAANRDPELSTFKSKALAKLDNNLVADSNGYK